MTSLPFLVVLTLGALTAFGAMSIDMYLPSFPSLAASFRAPAGMVAYTLSAFFIGLSLGQLIYGPLADRYGRKPPLLVGIGLYIVASIGCAIAPSIEALIALRFLQALGGCAGMVLARAMVRDRFDPQASARVFSILMLVMGLAPILAPLIGGAVLSFSSWRGIFWVLTAFGITCLILTQATLSESLPPEDRTRRGLGDVFRLYGHLLVHPRFIGYALAGSCAQSGMFAYIAGSPFVFITLHHVPPGQYGFYFGTNAIGLVAASQLNARWLRKVPALRLLALALGFALVMGLWLAIDTWTGWGGFAGILVPLFGYVASLGFVMPNATAAALSGERSSLGQASSLMGTLQFGAATLSGAAVGALQNGTAVPMGAVIGGCGILAFVAARLAGHWQARAEALALQQP